MQTPMRQDRLTTTPDGCMDTVMSLEHFQETVRKAGTCDALTTPRTTPERERGVGGGGEGGERDLVGGDRIEHEGHVGRQRCHGENDNEQQLCACMHARHTHASCTSSYASVCMYIHVYTPMDTYIHLGTRACINVQDIVGWTDR